MTENSIEGNFAKRGTDWPTANLAALIEVFDELVAITGDPDARIEVKRPKIGAIAIQCAWAIDGTESTVENLVLRHGPVGDGASNYFFASLLDDVRAAMGLRRILG